MKKTIALEGLRFHGTHGVFDTEQLVGNEFVVDLYVTTKVDADSFDDRLGGTIDYGELAAICKEVMMKRRMLLETLASDILMRIKQKFPDVLASRVRVCKLHPPISGIADRSYVELESDYII